MKFPDEKHDIPDKTIPKKNKKAMLIIEIILFLCSAAFYILYLIRPEFTIMAAFMFPLFFGVYIYYIKGITALKEQGIKSKRFTIVRWVALIVYIISLIFGITMK